MQSLGAPSSLGEKRTCQSANQHQFLAWLPLLVWAYIGCVSRPILANSLWKQLLGPLCQYSIDAINMGSATANPLSEEFEKDVLAALKEWHVPGMAIAVIDNDNIYSKVRHRVINGEPRGLTL